MHTRRDSRCFVVFWAEKGVSRCFGVNKGVLGCFLGKKGVLGCFRMRVMRVIRCDEACAG